MMYSYTDSTASQTSVGAATSILSCFTSDSSHPLYGADRRIVSGGIRAWLTTPYINSTGQFLGATLLGTVASNLLYDYMGDSPRH